MESRASIQIVEKPLFTIFLDIDRVIFSRETADANLQDIAFENANLLKGYLKKSDSNCFSNNYWSVIYAHHFDSPALDNLMDLIHKAELVAKPQIVIHSRWRKTATTLEMLKEVFFGMHEFARYIVGKTANEVDPFSPHSVALKADEIRHWLDAHPEVAHYVILDDDNDKRFHDYFKGKSILINGRTLLTKENVETALKSDSIFAQFTKEPTYLPSNSKTECFENYRKMIEEKYSIPMPSENKDD